MICSASVFSDDLHSLLELMTEYREVVCQNMSNPVFDDKEVECILEEVSQSLATYLAEILPPLTTALRYQQLKRPHTFI